MLFYIEIIKFVYFSTDNFLLYSKLAENHELVCLFSLSTVSRVLSYFLALETSETAVLCVKTSMYFLIWNAPVCLESAENL